MLKSTIVTGIWDLGREKLGDGWSRSFDHYINNFSILLNNIRDIPTIIFIDKDHEDIVWKHRSRDNTAVYHHSAKDFDNNFFPKAKKC